MATLPPESVRTPGSEVSVSLADVFAALYPEAPDPPNACEGRPGTAPLGSNKDKSTVGLQTATKTACERWPENLRLRGRSATGYRLVKGRCGATNLCDYCATRSCIENAELLALDALHGNAPDLVAILGTGLSTVDLRQFCRSREFVFRALRRDWPETEYAYLVEYTLGRSLRSGGRRFPHWNIPIKGIPSADHGQAAEVIRETWARNCPGALPQAQYVEPLRTAGGLMRYLFDHFAKIEQRPPATFRGRRFGTSRGYLWTDNPSARKVARDSLAAKAALWKARQELPGASAHDLELRAAEMRAENDGFVWDLVELVRSGNMVVDIRGFDEPHRGRSWRPTPASGDAPART